MARAHPESTLGGRIAYYRELRKLSQPELARRVKVHPMTISKWERDERKPSSDNLRDVALALKVSMSMLFGQENPDTEAALKKFEVALQGMESRSLKADERTYLRVVLESFFRVGAPDPPVLMDFLSAYRKSDELRAQFALPVDARR